MHVVDPPTRRLLVAGSLPSGRSPDRLCFSRGADALQGRWNRPNPLQIRADCLSLLFREACPEIHPLLSTGFSRPAKDIRASSPDTQPPRASGSIIDLQRTSIIVRIPPCEFTGQCWSRRCSLWLGAETDQIPSILIAIMRARKNDLTASMQLAAVR